MTGITCFRQHFHVGLCMLVFRVFQQGCVYSHGCLCAPCLNMKTSENSQKTPIFRDPVAPVWPHKVCTEDAQHQTHQQICLS